MATDLQVVGKPKRKVDAAKLVTGRGTFTDDIFIRGMLHAKILTSPHAHARITQIDTSHAPALPGVHAAISYQDVKRIPYTSAGQSWPEPSPYDQYILDNKVRFVGDYVAAVAAETPEMAEAATELIEVEYELLPAVLDMHDSMKPGAPTIHDEPESHGMFDADRNLAAHIEVEVGNVDGGLGRGGSRRNRGVLRPVSAAYLPRAACDHRLDGRGRPVGSPHEHPDPLPLPADGGVRSRLCRSRTCT